ncbi:5-formyltetrahydrofolate cyclo-ligase [Neisseria animalis]|uniref:5-formyltetrahydrofolate cyclo-ligase n=1 Tax=Neisseria animalis TaxID=492 RepID=A0A5P3MSK2_NEIAN|nr:5-formyltetrahydrofolate cyclo-ligase [Neisseria animalis]QEY23771.1 5-formyltetrahydrofolate cyclo-ligase [Neisseria animalis]ROW31621.1 5-formyltetrahydrofolate cyclo-ligase [Neisseria animalis]VEE09680.1 5-formyltetrahydrofolate cyclo-ligase [Neisseria animalis]
MSQQQKNELRHRLRRARSDMSAAERENATRTINRLLKRCIKKGGRIGIYWPIGKELCLDGFVRSAVRRGAKLYLPYIEPHSKRLWFTPYFADSTQQPERKRGASKLYIPQFSGKKIRVHDLDLLLVPIVGIDKQGYRLGQAGGFYDVSLAAARYRLPVFTLGVGFACQLVESLPREAHDIPLNGFVSERGALRFRSKSRETIWRHPSN